jgi:hypothetical protein
MTLFVAANAIRTALAITNGKWFRIESIMVRFDESSALITKYNPPIMTPKPSQE